MLCTACDSIWPWRTPAAGGSRGAFRMLVLAVAVFLLLGIAGGELRAQESWPAYSTGRSDPHEIVRGPGFYFAPWKIALLLVVVFAWVKSADWVGRDTDEMGEAIGMPGQVWNPIIVFAPIVGFLLAITIPIFLAGWGVMLLTWAVPFLIYVVQRNGKVTQDKKVFTREHLQHWLASLGKRQPKQREVKHAWQLGPPLEMVAIGPLQMENQQALIEARQNSAFVSVKYLLADALAQRAERIRLEFTADAVAVQYQVDGVWLNANPKVHDKHALDRKLGDSMLVVLKRICHLKPQERRAKQEGKTRVDFEGNKYETSVITQGTQTGERVVIHLVMVTKHIPALEELGMRDKLREQLAELIGPGHHGLVVFASLPGDGLSATWRAALRSTDRLMRDFVSIEDVHKREPDVENVDVNKFDASKGEKVEAVMPKLILKQPEVMCIPELASGEALTKLTKWIQDEDRLGLVSVRAKDAVDTLMRLLSMKVPPESLSGTLRGVVYTRLIRRLCETCRQAVQPSPELLQRLGIPAGRVQVLYQEKQPLAPGEQRKRGEPEICPACKGIGYKGRIGIYELMVLDDKMRQALLKGPKAETLKQLSRAAGNRTLQEEGILLVALGTTSIAELQRVLKQ
jgi:type II secretory ATPase GspE/PulE/Tfp pilus assembly ATPase PilB-like protein